MIAVQRFDSEAINEAIESVSKTGGVVHVPRGTYIIRNPVILPSMVSLVGDGAGTILRLAAYTNCNLIESVDFPHLTGTGKWAVREGVPHSFGVSNLRIDGNKSLNGRGSGIAFYGKGYTVDSVIIHDCAEYGMYSECGARIGQRDWRDMPETRIDFVKIRDCNKHGLLYRGPHNGSIGEIESAYNGDWGAEFDHDHSPGAGYDGNVSRITLLHTYANANHKGIRINAIVTATDLIGDGDNIEIVDSACRIGMLKVINAGGMRDGLRLEGSNTTIGQVDISMHERSVNMDACVITGEGNIIQSGILKGNKHKNDGLSVLGRKNIVKSMRIEQFRDGGIGFLMEGVRNQAEVQITSCDQALCVKNTSKCKLVADVYVSDDQRVGVYPEGQDYQVSF